MQIFWHSNRDFACRPRRAGRRKAIYIIPSRWLRLILFFSIRTIRIIRQVASNTSGCSKTCPASIGASRPGCSFRCTPRGTIAMRCVFQIIQPASSFSFFGCRPLLYIYRLCVCFFLQAHQGEPACEQMKASYEALLLQYQVDAVFSGHVHSYERTLPLENGRVNPDTGITYIGIGDGGNREGPASTWLNPQPAWSAFREAKFGHGRLGMPFFF